MLQRMRSETGAAMLLVLLTVAVLSLLGLALAEMSRAHMMLAYRERQSLQALDLAEAGLDRAVAELWSDPGWSGVSNVGLAGIDGSYTVTVVPDSSPARVVATSTGTCGRVTRTVRGTIMVVNTLNVGQGLTLRDSLAWPGGRMEVHGSTQIGGNLTVTGGNVRFDGPTTLAGTLSDPGRRVTATVPIVQRGAVVPPVGIDPATFHNQPWDSIDIDYPGGARLDNTSLKGGLPFLSDVYYIAHVEGNAVVDTLSASNKLPSTVQMVIIAADGSVRLDGQVKVPKGAALVVIAGGDIIVDQNCALDDTTLMAGGNLVLNRDLDISGSVTADTIVANTNKLTVTQQDLTTVTLPVALQVSLLTWEEVTPP